MEETKVCVSCGEMKPLSHFKLRAKPSATTGKRELDSWCRECYRVSSLIYRVKDIDKARKGVNRRLSEKRLQVLRHFGGGKVACAACGESRVDCLSIDHINGGGNKHRRWLLSKGIQPQGYSYYKWLLENGSTADYQVLCMNCQFIKQKNNNWDKAPQVKFRKKDKGIVRIGGWTFSDEEVE